jgi:hypothetical protein
MPRSADAFYAGSVRSLLRILAVVGLMAAASACTSDGDEPAGLGTADAFTAIVGWQVAQSGPPTTGQPLPVVYIAADDGTTIDPSVQATVAGNTVDMAKVRFADARDDAIDVDVEAKPVKDDGVLLIVDKFDPKGATDVPVGVAVYHDASNEQHLVLTVAAGDQGARVTSSSVRPSG